MPTASQDSQRRLRRPDCGCTFIGLERRNPMLQMMLRSTDIMQAILTDLHHSLHPAGVHIRMPLPGIRLESFWDAEQIIEMGAVQAREALTAAGMYPQEPAGR